MNSLEPCQQGVLGEMTLRERRPSTSSSTAAERHFTDYQKAVERWESRIKVTVKDTSGAELLKIPWPWFSSVNAASWTEVSYLRFLIDLVICERDFELVTNGVNQQDHDQIVAGIYHISLEGNRQVTDKHGPVGKNLYRIYEPEDTASTVSRSSRDSTGQNQLKFELAQRDRFCLLTGIASPNVLVASHIVPFSFGQEFLDELVGEDGLSAYSVANGLLLCANAHKTFDDYEWSLYETRGRYFIHIFGSVDFLEHHGREVFFPGRPKTPERLCLKYHYTQCVMRYFRRFSIFKGLDWKAWLREYDL